MSRRRVLADVPSLTHRRVLADVSGVRRVLAEVQV